MEIQEQSQLIYGVTTYDRCSTQMGGNQDHNATMVTRTATTKQHQEVVELERKDLKAITIEAKYQKNYV